MASQPKSKARIVIHGGAGNITHSNLPPPARHEYLAALAHILQTLNPLLTSSRLSALDIAVTAVKMLEDNPLFNAGKGAVFTLTGTNELEASVMVSRGAHKRCAGVFLLKHVKNPILLAKELLLRDNVPGGPGKRERGRQHNCLSGEFAEQLADKWGLEIVEQDYFFTEKRWKQHLDDLKRWDANGEGVDRTGDDEVTLHGDRKEEFDGIDHGLREKRRMENQDGGDEDIIEEYLPKGTVGCVVLDNDGVIAVATSTGGLTNKVPGRIGDTPTPGAGFWADEWSVDTPSVSTSSHKSLTAGAGSFIKRLEACLPFPRSPSSDPVRSHAPTLKTHRSVALSGTGNGDYFLRLSACHNIASRCRFGGKSLKQAAKEVVGPGGEMDRAGEGRKGSDGAIIGIDEEGEIVMEMNCGGCFRAMVDDNGKVLVAAYADEELEEWQF